MATKIPIRRLVSTALGITAAGLGCYGAFTAAKALEGGVSYLTIAAPVVALAAALIPPIAEDHWITGDYVKSLLWWALLLPAALVVGLSSFERVHNAKAGQSAERLALTRAAQRADADLETAKVALQATLADEVKAKATENCAERPKCRVKLQAAQSARERVAVAEKTLLEAEAKAKAEAPMTAPAWLLPLTLDALAFMAVWSATTGPKPVKKAPRVPHSRDVEKPARRTREKKAPRPSTANRRQLKKLTSAAGNDNVIPMRNR